MFYALGADALGPQHHASDVGVAQRLERLQLLLDLLFDVRFEEVAQRDAEQFRPDRPADGLTGCRGGLCAGVRCGCR